MPASPTSEQQFGPREYGVPTITDVENAVKVGYCQNGGVAHLLPKDTGGNFFLTRTFAVTPKEAPPFHRHSREDEIWIILNGKFRFWIGGDTLDSAETFDIGPGAVVYGPRGVAHSFQAQTERGEFYCLLSPGVSADYFLNDTQAAHDTPGIESIGVEILDRSPAD